jgi:hypothetical protein
VWHSCDETYEGITDLSQDEVLLGYTKLENIIRYLGIEVDEALEMTDQCKATVEVRPPLTGPKLPLMSDCCRHMLWPFMEDSD